MLKTQNHVLATTTSAMPLSTNTANFLLSTQPVGPPWQVIKETAKDKVAFMLTQDIFAPPREMEIIHALARADGALYDIDRAMEGSNLHAWPMGTHVVSVVTEGVLDAYRKAADVVWRNDSSRGGTCKGFRYRRHSNGMVELDVFSSDGTIPKPVSGYLPQGYRPSSTLEFPVAWSFISENEFPLSIGYIRVEDYGRVLSHLDSNRLLGTPGNFMKPIRAVFYADGD